MRRNRDLLLWFSMCLTIIFIVLNAKSATELLESASVAEKRNLLQKQEGSRVDDRRIARNQDVSHVLALDFNCSKVRSNSAESGVLMIYTHDHSDCQTHRYVTPSLAELGGRGRLPYMYKHVLMLTRIPGTGAELMVLILQRLQGLNAFKHIRLPSGDHGLLSTLKQELLVEEVTSIIKQEAIPLSFDGDVRFLNFSEFGRQGPTFISLVRNPLDPRIWQRYDKGGKEVLYRGAIPHFCGHEPRCTERNNTWALERAKANIIRWYPVVGILDYMEESLNALAIEFPYFFKGATRIYDQLRPKEEYFPTSSVALNVRVKDVSLRKVLAQEVEFYQWLKSRLLNKTFSDD